MKKEILIVVDMQNDFISGSLGSDRGKEIVPRVLERVKYWPGSIIATRDTHYDNYLETQEGKNLPVPHCISGTPGWEIESTIMEELLKKGPKRVKFIEKPTFGSYYALPENIDYIRDGEDPGNLEITLVGLCTDICVLSNAILLKARYPEAKIHVDASLCGGTTLENHERALQSMRCCQIDIQNWALKK